MSESAAASERRAKSPWRWVVRALAVVTVVGLGFLLWSRWDHQALLAWKQEASPLLFFAALATLPAIGIPMTPLSIVAGATFGVRIGLLGSAVALGLNLALCYWIARSGLRPRLESLLRRFDYELPNFAEKEEGAIRFTLLVKLTPGVPAFAKNYLLGLSGIPFPLYFIVSMLITGLYGALLVVVGEGLFDHELSRTVAAGAVLVGLALGAWWWWRRRGRDDRNPGPVTLRTVDPL